MWKHVDFVSHQTSARDNSIPQRILDEELPIVDRNAIGKQKEWILFSLPNHETTTTSLIALSSLCRQPTMKKPHDKYSKQERCLLTVAASAWMLMASSWYSGGV
jgi:hypothetical protein